MAHLFCPSCRQPLTDGPIGAASCCPFCGNSLLTQSPMPPRYVKQIDMRLLAKRQRMLLWIVLALLVSQGLPFLIIGTPFLPYWVEALWPFLWLVLLLFVVIGVVMILAALRMHFTLIALFAILMFAPCINLLVLVNSMATRALRRAGLHVGFMGVKDEGVVRLLSPNLCQQCAYDLTGNVSGRCPECGTPIPRAEPLA